jgi:phage terminase Nu1 subunit (DNA packaging protein)
MTDTEDWLEGEDQSTTRIPIHGLTKRELAAAFNMPPKQIDKFVREGMPSRSMGTNRGGLRFDLAPCVEFRIGRAVAAQGGSEDQSTVEAKRRLAVAQAQRKEIENAKLLEELVPLDLAIADGVRKAGAIRNGILTLPSQVHGLSDTQRDQLDAAIHDLLSDVHAGNYDSEFEEIEAMLKNYHETRSIR